MIKPIGTKEQIEKKNKRNVLLISIILILIMVISTAGYFSLNGSGNNNQQDSHKIGNQWVYNYGDNVLRFGNSLQDTKNVSVSLSRNIGDFYGKVVYLTFNDTEAKYEVGQALGGYTLRIQEACYENCTENLPVKTCSDLLIVFVPSTDEKVYEEGNCTFIEGNLRAADAFLYTIFGIK